MSAVDWVDAHQDGQYRHLRKSNADEMAPAGEDCLRDYLRKCNTGPGETFLRALENDACSWNAAMGSPHEWFQGRGGRFDGRAITLVTIATMSRFRTEESSDVSNLAYYFLDLMDLRQRWGDAANRLRSVLIIRLSGDDGMPSAGLDDDKSLEFRVRAALSLLMRVVDAGKLRVYVCAKNSLKRVFDSDLASVDDEVDSDPLFSVIPVVPLSSASPALRSAGRGSLDSLQSSRVAYSEDEIDRLFEAGNQRTGYRGQDVVNRLLWNLTAEMAERLFSRTGGTLKNKLTAKGKARIIQTVKGEMREHLASTNILAQFLYLYMVTSAIMGKDLLGLAKGDPSDVARLRGAAFDALSCAEGVLQLVENSCIHTASGVALLSISCRNLASSRSGLATVDEVKATMTRRMFESRYDCAASHAPLSHGYHIEVRVMDVAGKVLSGGRVVRGMPETFSATHQGAGSVTSVSDLIAAQGRPGELGDVVTHYGIRMLLRIVAANRGVAHIRTPIPFDGASGYKAALWNYGADSTGKERVEERYEDGGRFTEFSVMLPALRPDKGHSEGGASLLHGELYDSSRLGRMGSPRYSAVWFVGEYGQDLVMRCEGDLLTSFGQGSKHLEDGSSPGDIAAVKSRAASLVANTLRAHFRSSPNGGDPIFLIECRPRGLADIELFAKGLYGSFYAFKGINAAPVGRKLHVAVMLSSKSEIFHFLRIASVFYTKSVKKDKYTRRDFLLYVCCPSSERVLTDGRSVRIPELCFVLAGDSVESAQKTAEIFCYYHASETLDMTQFIGYLCRSSVLGEAECDKRGAGGGESLELVPIIPVDAYLGGWYDDVGSGARFHHSPASNESWLIRRLEAVVNRDAGGPDAGCRHSEVHVHIGAKVHIPMFFQCTAIFQNVALSKKLAFLLASDMLSDLYSTRRESSSSIKLYIYGYEGYSSLLVQEIVRLLESYGARQSEGWQVRSLVYVNEEDTVLGVGDLLKDLLEEPGCILVYPVLPIATTCSTLYKMLDRLDSCLVEDRLASFSEMRLFRSSGRRSDLDVSGAEMAGKCLEEISSLGTSFSTASIIVLVGSSSDNPTQVEGRYRMEESEVVIPALGKDEKPWFGGLVTLAASSGLGGGLEDYLRARWYVKARVEWSDPIDEGCPYCIDSDGGLNERVLLSADRTGTVAKVAFSELDGNSALEEVRRRHRFWGRRSKTAPNLPEYPLLFGAIDYGHFWDRNGHSQFHIDASRVYSNVMHGTRWAYEDWLRGQRESLDRGTYNVLIAPIETAESGFYNDVIDLIFESSIRVIHTNLRDSGVDDIRSRYCSVVRDLSNLVRNGRGDDIRFYYSQTCLRSGRSLRKAEAVVRMFNREAAIAAVAPVFTKVFCLVNQSVEYISSARSIAGFIELNVPSLGIKSASCPICESIDRLELVARRCADEEVSTRLMRAAVRMRKKTPDEERALLKAEVLERRSYLEWLREWSEGSSSHPSGMLAWDLGKFVDEKQVNATASWVAEHAMLCTNIRDLDELFEGEPSVRKSGTPVIKPSRLMTDFVLQQRNLMRLACEDELGRLFGIDAPKARYYLRASSELDLIGGAVELLLSRIWTRMEGSASKYLKKEWLISYLKTVSRGRMLLVHHVRQAALTVSLCLVDALASNAESGGHECVYLTEKSRELLRNIAGSVDSMDSPMRLRIEKVLVGRLGDLGSTYLLRPETLGPLIKLVSEDCLILKGEAGKSRALEIVKMAMTRCVVLGEDTSKATYAWRLREALERGDELPGLPKGDNLGLYDGIMRAIDLCVTPVLFTGVERLWRAWNTVPMRESMLALARNVLTGEKQSDLSIKQNGEKVRAIVDVFQSDLRGRIESGFDCAGRRADGEGQWRALAEVAAFLDKNSYRYYRLCARQMIGSVWNAAHEEGDSQRALLAMNPLSRFFSFAFKPGVLVNQINGPESEDHFLDCLAGMLLLFKYVMDLAGNAHVGVGRDSRPEVYEGICSCMRDLLGAQGCLLVYVEQGNPRIILGSSIEGNLLSSETTRGDGMGKCPWGEESLLEARTLQEVRRGIGDGSLSRMSFVVTLSDKVSDTGGGERRKRMACFVPMWKDALESEGPETGRTGAEGQGECRFKKEIPPNALRKVLFLRNQLAEVLERDLVQLLQDQYDYSGVGRIAPCDTAHRVLHLTDLHLSRSDAKATDALIERMDNNASKRSGAIWHREDPLFDTDFDLVAITGDVAQASRSGSGQRENYRYAGRFIRSLARYLWSDVDGKVRWDWFKRVMVVTGNHDYTSSSDFESMTIAYRRTSEIAKPSRTSTETPAQFIYFYDFLHHVLRADLGVLWANKLNEVRNYDRLKASFVMLNSSALVGPLRTNKVGLVRGLSSQNVAEEVNRDNRVVFLVHHAPTYNINYVLDEFLSPEFFELDGRASDLREMVSAIERYSTLNDPLLWAPVDVPQVGDITQLSDPWIQWSLNRRHASGSEQSERELRGEAKDALSDCNRRRRESTLSLSLRRANDCVRDGVLFDESLVETASVIKRFESMSKSDAADYGKSLGSILASLRGACPEGSARAVFLCGHTHISSHESFAGACGSTNYDADVCVLGRFYEGLWFASTNSSTGAGDRELLRGFVGQVIRENIDGALDKPVNIRRCDAFRYGELVGRGDADESYDMRGVLAYEGKYHSFTIGVSAEGVDGGGSEDSNSAPVSPDGWKYRTEQWSRQDPIGMAE